MRRIICLTALTVLLAACRQECPETTAFHIAEADSWTVRTRSLLTASDIETRKTGITLAAYADGTLAASGHFATGLDAMVLDLEPDRPHTLYALVNMGDMTGALPRSESELSAITYRIPSYTEGTGALASRGIPMAGRLAWPDQGTVIPVRRLLAKVTAHLSCDWTGASIRSVRVCNLNRMLRPFGDAVREEDWDQQEFQEGTGASSGTFVFYVPENRQGTIDGIRSSLDKSPDRNTAVRAKQDALTYLEASVTSTESIYAGDITYRSYLGGNATTDFDIERNGLYDWTVVYHGDRTQDQDWKRDGDMFQVVVTADKTDAYVGETVRLTASCRRNDHGAETVTDVTNAAIWTKQGGGSAAISISKGAVTATAPGTAAFRAGYTLNGRTAYGDGPTITFRERPPLTITWTEQAAYVGQRGSFTVSNLADGATITSVELSGSRRRRHDHSQVFERPDRNHYGLPRRTLSARCERGFRNRPLLRPSGRNGRQHECKRTWRPSAFVRLLYGNDRKPLHPNQRGGRRFPDNRLHRQNLCPGSVRNHSETRADREQSVPFRHRGDGPHLGEKPDRLSVFRRSVHRHFHSLPRPRRLRRHPADRDRLQCQSVPGNHLRHDLARLPRQGDAGAVCRL